LNDLHVAVAAQCNPTSIEACQNIINGLFFVGLGPSQWVGKRFANNRQWGQVPVMEIRKKLFLIIATSVLVTTIPGGYAMYTYTQRQVVNAASTELEAATVWLAGALEQRIDQHGSEPLSPGFRPFSALSARYPGTQHFLLDPAGNFVHAGT
jgi:hypothetical protein